MDQEHPVVEGDQTVAIPGLGDITTSAAAGSSGNITTPTIKTELEVSPSIIRMKKYLRC